MVSFVGGGIDFFFNLLRQSHIFFATCRKAKKATLSKRDLFPGLSFCPVGRALSGVSGKAAPCYYVLVSSRTRPPGPQAQGPKEMKLKAQTSHIPQESQQIRREQGRERVVGSEKGRALHW